MARFIGDQTQSALLYESGTYANTSGDAQWIGMVQNCNIVDDVGKIGVRYNHGTTRNVEQWVDTLKRASASFSYYPQNWKMLAFALGSNVDTSGSNSTHVMSEADSDSSNEFTSGTDAPFISFGLEDAKRFNPTGLNHIKTMRGGMVNTMVINLPQGEPATVDIDAIGQAVTYASGAASSVTAATTPIYLSQHAVWNLPSGTALNEVNDATITIANNTVAEPWQTGSDVVKLPYQGNREYTIDLGIDSNPAWSKKFYNQYFKGGSEFNLFFRMAPSGNRYLEMTFSGCEVPAMDDPSTFEGAQVQRITIRPKSCSAKVQDRVVLYNPW